MNKTITYTASDARKNFYGMVKDAATGLVTYEVNLQGSEPVVILSKSDFESLLETAEIMSIPGARTSVVQGLEDAQNNRGSHLEDLV